MDDSVDVKFGASVDGLDAGVKQASSSVAAGVASMVSSLATLGGAAGKIGGVIAAGLSVLTSGALFKASIAESAALGREVEDLSRRFSITAREASMLSFAIGDAYLTVGEFTGATDKLMRNLRSNEETLTKLGVKTRDTNGAFVDQKTLTFNALDALREYKQGTDQLLAAQTLFGRGMDENVLKKLMETQEYYKATILEADKYGRVLGVENVKAAEDYRTATRGVGDAMQGVRLIIGNALLPVTNNWLNLLENAVVSILPALSGVLKVIAVALAFVTQVAYGLFQVFKSLFQTVGQFIGGVTAAVAALVSGGGWEGAKAAWGAMTEDMSATWKENADNIEERTAKLQAAIKNIWDGPDASADQKFQPPEGRSGGKSFVDPNVAEKAASDLLALLRRQLEEMKRSEGDYQEFSKEKEVQFWEEKRNLFARGSKQWQEANILYLAARRAAAQESVDIQRFEYDQQAAEAQTDAQRKVQLADSWLARMAVLYGADSRQYRDALKEKAAADRDYANQQKQIQDIRAKAALDVKNTELELASQLIASRVALGQMEKEEAYRLQQVIMEERYAMQVADLERRKQLYQGDVIAQEQINAERLALEAKHAQDLAILHQTQQQEVHGLWTQAFDGIASSFEGVLYGLLTKTMTWRQAMQQILGGVLQMFIKMGMDKVKAWIVSEVLMTNATKLYNMIRTAMDSSGAAASVAAKSAEAGAKITASAGVAAAGAAESQASIPIAGPALAAAAAAMMFALVLGFKGASGGGGSTPTSLPSAAGGWWDVPGDTLAMIHKKEMVMPGDLAEGVRTMVENGGPGAGGPIHIHATDADSFRNLLKRSGDDLFDVLRTKIKDNRSY